jgi:hypothetical protein
MSATAGRGAAALAAIGMTVIDYPQFRASAAFAIVRWQQRAFSQSERGAGGQGARLPELPPPSARGQKAR